MLDAAGFRRLVGKNIKKARWLSGMTQQATAEAAQLNYRYLQEIERGVRNPSLDVLFVIATTLGVTVADLVDVERRSRRPVKLIDEAAEPPKRGRKPTKAPAKKRS